MHATDYQSRTRPKHQHQWHRREDDSQDTLRCTCGARCGKMTFEEYIAMFYPPGVSLDVIQGRAPQKAPKLPPNWRGK